MPGTWHCHCAHCTSLGGEQGLEVKAATFRAHKKRYGQAQASSLTSAAPQPVRKRQRLAEPSPADLLDDLLAKRSLLSIPRVQSNENDETSPQLPAFESDETQEETVNPEAQTGVFDGSTDDDSVASGES
ncbi:uncharacterized protein SPSC_01761 [Sporisorium scitamineum]|uniref:Uncharacterized protein n=1 Tax=Sporisorium scitamineum TaxID=49012 RepID=A0A127ZAG1_9BASI|nr:uncharacterized protein SPSC_01761 [Sporisorium scitamineum]